MDVDIKIQCTFGNTNGRQHQSSMHYWQCKWASTSKFYARPTGMFVVQKFVEIMKINKVNEQKFILSFAS